MRVSDLAPLAVLTLTLLADVAALDDHYQITEEQYYEMPRLFHLDEYEACLARRREHPLYCLGTFELSPTTPGDPLYQMMQSYSANWVDHFNHTLLHRGVCVSARCPQHDHDGGLSARSEDANAARFQSCVNASTMSGYKLSARLISLGYCHRVAGGERRPFSTSERAFAGVCAALLALAALSTTLDLTLPDHTKKDASWALSWSVVGSWRALRAPPPRSGAGDLRAFDGLRVLCMMFVIIEHVCWITTHAYLADTRRFELDRRAVDAMMMANSTLVVQIFFLMSSFLLAHKLLQQQARGVHINPISTFFETMLNRIIRISPSYFMVVWFAASWWERLGEGPMWPPLVEAEAAVCRRKWWTHLLYLNNILDADNKCLIQTWYLAADMQLYAAAAALTLALRRCGRGAAAALAALLAAAVALLGALAYVRRLVPTYVMHNPESVRVTYAGSASFDTLYQSPLGNAPGALAGLLLAHAHHRLRAARLDLAHYKVFRWISTASVPLAVWWVAASPRVLPAGGSLHTEGGPRAAAAALAALERPVFAAFVTLALLAAIHGVPSAVRSVLSWSGWSVCARLSFGALLLHMPINKALVAARRAPTQLDRQSAIVEWFGVASVSYLAALPLALLVELPAQRLQRALQRRGTLRPVTSHADSTHKTDL